MKIAERCNVEFTFGKYHLPEFKLPAGYDSLTYLKELCTKGFAERYGEEHPEYRQQLDYEIDMIEKMGFTDYFLIVADFVNFAKQGGHPRSAPGAEAPRVRWSRIRSTSRRSTR